MFLLKPASNYNLSNEYELTVRPIKTAHYGLNSLAYFGLRIWELLINNLKRIESVEALNLKLKTGYLKTVYAVFVNHISTKWALRKFISKDFKLLIYLIRFYEVIGEWT